MSRGWAKASACRLQMTLSCAVLCHTVSLQYLSRSSLHRLAGLPCRLFIHHSHDFKNGTTAVLLKWLCLLFEHSFLKANHSFVTCKYIVGVALFLVVVNYIFLFLLQLQEMRTGATRQNMESVHSKEENKRLRSQLGDLRAKLNDSELRVSAATCRICAQSYTIMYFRSSLARRARITKLSASFEFQYLFRLLEIVLDQLCLLK